MFHQHTKPVHWAFVGQFPSLPAQHSLPLSLVSLLLTTISTSPSVILHPERQHGSRVNRGPAAGQARPRPHPSAHQLWDLVPPFPQLRNKDDKQEPPLDCGQKEGVLVHARALGGLALVGTVKAPPYWAPAGGPHPRPSLRPASRGCSSQPIHHQTQLGPTTVFVTLGLETLPLVALR